MTGIEQRMDMAKRASQDYYRLKFHIMPEGGWLNDPNGLIQYKGKYHVFYQHNPYAPERGPLHWGHVDSDDLMHWNYLPFALTADQYYEKKCFSGSAVDNNGELTLIYTAHDLTRSPKEVQCVAFSNDGINFKKYENNPVIKAPPPGFDEEFRDPKVLKYNDLWYMVVGCSSDNRGGINLYSSKDLRHWEYKGMACKSDGTQGDMWECPDLFKLENLWVIATSPMKMKNSKCIFITGDMDFNACSFTQKQWRDVDYGYDFYAPQTFEDAKKRRIMIAWMGMWGEEIPTIKNGWAGALTVPRELFLQKGEVWQKPVEEISFLRKKELFKGTVQLNAGSEGNLKSVTGDCLELKFTIPVNDKNHGKLHLYLRTSKDKKERSVLIYDFTEKCFIYDKRNSGAGRNAENRLPSVDWKDEIPVHVIIDRSSVEIFLYGGKYAVTNRIYPQPSSLFYDLVADGIDIKIQNFQAWYLDV